MDLGKTTMSTVEEEHVIQTDLFVTDRIRSLGQGNAFTHFCRSIHGEGGLPSHNAMGQVDPLPPKVDPLPPKVDHHAIS